MAITVSIIIPIYNIESYLRQCLDSICVLGNANYEIILINDGSTDRSGEICMEYVDRWNNVELINKLNGGLSDARNCGLSVANGEFIFFLDSDDWLAPDAIDILYRFAVQNDCEIVQGGFYYAFDNYLEYDNCCFNMDNEPFVLDRKSAMFELIKNGYIKNFAWGKLFKASIVKSYPFPIGKYYEDSFWMHHIVNNCKRYGVIPKPLYYYRQRKDSISGTSSYRLFDLIEGLEQRYDFVSENYPEFAEQMAETLWRVSFSIRRINDDFKKSHRFINDKYRTSLPNKFKESLYYKLACGDSKPFQLYQLFIKMYNRLFGKKIKRIKLSN